MKNFAANPFSPGKRMTKPDLFAGRKDQLRAIVPMLRQTAADNARHILITGERGIGKSSFSSQVQGIARGETQFLRLIGEAGEQAPVRMLVVEHITQDRQGAADIAAGILGELESAKGLQRFLDLDIDFTIDLGPLSTTLSRRDVDTQDVVTKFVDEVQKISEKVSDKVDGILIVVDEIDRSAEVPGVSSFFKVATEKLSSRGIENVAFALVGIVGTLDALSVEHKSVRRIFRPVEVPIMSNEDAQLLFSRALDDTGVGIDREALDFLIKMGDGYPNTLHVLGEQAYDMAVEGQGFIDKAVARRALAQVIKDSSKEDLDRRYLEVSRGRARSILRFIASRDTEQVSLKDVLGHLKKKNSDVSQYFDSLLRADILIRTEQGMYKFREQIFREYVREIDRSGVEPEQRRPVRRTRDY